MPPVLHVHPRSEAGCTKKYSGHHDKSMSTYQPELYSYLRKSVSSNKALNIVEISAGTGVFTRGLLDHAEWKSSISMYKAVEPSDGMRDVFRNNIVNERVSISAGTFNCTGVEDGWADFVVIATALLWCFDYDSAATEFNRILKPGGVLSLPCVCLADVSWTAEVNSLDERFTKEPGFFSWRKLYHSPVFKTYFELVEEKIFNYDLIGSVEGLKNHVKSWTRITVLDGVAQAKVMKDIEVIVNNADDSEREWVDRDQGVLKIPFDAMVPVIHKK